MSYSHSRPSEVDESSKDIYLECAGCFLDKVDAADGDSAHADEEGERMPYLHPLQSNAPSNLELPVKHSPFRRSSFLGARTPTITLEEGGIRFKSAMAWARITFKVLETSAATCWGCYYLQLHGVRSVEGRN